MIAISPPYRSPHLLGEASGVFKVNQRGACEVNMRARGEGIQLSDRYVHAKAMVFEKRKKERCLQV